MLKPGILSSPLLKEQKRKSKKLERTTLHLKTMDEALFFNGKTIFNTRVKVKAM
jgi:hypothetical protein